ncbi:Uncharacterized membrane protein YczE [Amycolatopsis australiensis]|uniref:Uncharacterized membrane protein YczE n=1 Tax=Amycolatopsis australiensis TaxID=546364 RepID=A0A1K1LPP1_9PSEU|nr:Uncharacterized membrane protein YczE [Amycolatopsis australiensis]
MLGTGTLTMGVGIALLVASRLGMVPMDTVHLAVAHQLGWTLGLGILACQATLLATFLPLKVRPGIGTAVGLVVPAVTADAVLAFLPSLNSLVVRLIVFTAGGGLFCLGVALYLAAALGPLPRDGLMLVLGGDREASGHNGWRLALARIGIDVVFVAGATAIFGPAEAVRTGAVGVGTVVLALASGPVIARALRRLRRIPSLAPPTSAQPRPVRARHAAAETT